LSCDTFKTGLASNENVLWSFGLCLFEGRWLDRRVQAFSVHAQAVDLCVTQKS